MTRAAIAVFGALIAACGPVRDGKPACSRSDRTGAYLVRYTEISGTCGALSDELEQLEDGRHVGDAATSRVCVEGVTEWSDDECAVDATFTCTTPEGAFDWDTATEQLTSSGAELSGTGSVRVRDASAGVSCSGSYDLVATRQ